MTASSVVTFFIETPFRMVLPNMTRPRLSVLLSLSLRIGLRGQLAERDLELWLDQLGSRRLHQCIESHALLREGGPAEAELGVAALDDAALDAVARETGVVEDGLQLADPMAVVEGNAVGGPERVEDPDRLGHLAQREAHHEDVRALLAPPAPVEVALKVVAAEDDGAASAYAPGTIARATRARMRSEPRSPTTATRTPAAAIPAPAAWSCGAIGAASPMATTQIRAGAYGRAPNGITLFARVHSVTEWRSRVKKFCRASPSMRALDAPVSL